MMSVGVNVFALSAQLLVLILAFLLPIVLGFTVVRADANRAGQSGWIWGVLTIPLGWLTILAYVIVRALMPRR